jgi:chromosomal replication initiation ATPase DnaA
MQSLAPRQTILELGGPPAHDRASLLMSHSNAEAVRWIDRWPDWPTHALAISGPPASGKTHLGEIWRLQAQADIVTPATLTADLLADIAARPRNVVLENADAIPGNPDLEQALFHLYNLQKETRRSLLLIGRLSPALWTVGLPDLASRLGAIPIVGIDQPDDELLTMLLAKLFADRQLVVPPDVLSYLLPRMERSFGAAEKIAADLDDLSLTHKRPLTVSLARMALEGRS